MTLELVHGTARLLAGLDRTDRVDLATHRSLHGEPVVLDRASLAAACEAVGLRGRGGAGFPVATKLRAVPGGRGVQVLVNGSEGEPLSRKDRALMRSAPHVVLDGAVVVARAMAAPRVTIAVHDAGSADSLRRAVAERHDAIDLRVERTRTGFVGGEVRALVSGLNGDAPVPPGRRVLPSARGLQGRPTFVSNVETFAQIALLARLGPAGFATVGTVDEGGTSLVTVLGDVPQRGVLEVPHGTTIADLVGGRDGPVLVGGYHGTWVDGAGELLFDRPSLADAGVGLGSAVLLRPAPDTCVLPALADVARWLAGESTGRCGPCVFGLDALAADVAAAAEGRGDLDRVARRLDLVRGRGACGHPDGAVRFLASALQVFADDVEQHLSHGSCGRPDSAVLTVPGRS